MLKVTIIEFGDFQCPYCGKAHSTIKQLLALLPRKVRYSFRELPLDFHPMALPSARYFEAIALQSHAKARRFHDIVLENQKELNQHGEQFLETTAAALKVDTVRLKSDLNNDIITKRIEGDKEDAKHLGISGTPGFIVNGYLLGGAWPIEKFLETIAQDPP